jgi:hypothetical protein
MVIPMARRDIAANLRWELRDGADNDAGSDPDNDADDNPDIDVNIDLLLSMSEDDR